MIARLLNSAFSLFLYFCVATLLAQGIMLGYFWLTWRLDREKLVQILAVAQGIDLLAMHEKDEGDREEVSPEQVSFQEIIDRRAAMARDLELRETALKNGLDQLRSQRRQLAEDQQQHRQLVAEFNTRLLALTEGAEAGGREVVLRTLETIKPSQAKQQIVGMLANDEIDEVLLLFTEMSESKRAKILGEFKTPEENEKLGEVLRLIGRGEPQASLAEEAQKQLGPDNPTGS